MWCNLHSNRRVRRGASLCAERAEAAEGICIKSLCALKNLRSKFPLCRHNQKILVTWRLPKHRQWLIFRPNPLQFRLAVCGHRAQDNRRQDLTCGVTSILTAEYAEALRFALSALKPLRGFALKVFVLEEFAKQISFVSS